MENDNQPSSQSSSTPGQEPTQSAPGIERHSARRAEDDQAASGRHDDKSHYHKKHPAEWVLECAIAALLLLTLIATGTAAYYTKWQWITADDHEKRYLRSYIIVKSAWLEADKDTKKVTLARTNSAGNSAFLIYYEISNEGQTPAYEVEKKFTVEDTFKPNMTFNYTDGIAAYVGKQQIFGPIVTHHFTPDQINLILAGKGPLTFAGQMTYRDILGRTWRTNFCFRYVEDWSGQVRFVFCSRLSRDDRLNFAE